MDTIDRKAAIDLILSGKVDEDDSLVECAIECNSFLDWAADEVAKMPSAPRWIPVTEQLPEETGIYPVWTARGFGNHLSTSYWDGKEWSLRVVAWMPLPEPWKGEDK